MKKGEEEDDDLVEEEEAQPPSSLLFELTSIFADDGGSGSADELELVEAAATTASVSRSNFRLSRAMVSPTSCS